MAVHSFAQAQPAEVRLEETYEWPGQAVLRWSLTQGDLLVVSRSEQNSRGNGSRPPVFGICLPWLRCGPLLVRGMLRQVDDPLSFCAWSGVFQEHTGLALDGALQTPRAGVLFMPVPEQCGVYFRPGREGGTEFGAFGNIPLGAGAAAECVFLASRPDPHPASEEWFVTRSPFPGGDVTHFAARFVLDSPSLSCSYAAGASSAQLAAPGAFSVLWLRGRLPEIEGAVLVSGATPGYRAPDGIGTALASRFSASVRLGRDSRLGSLEAGYSFAAAEPGFSPRREVPTASTVRAAVSRDFAWESTRSLHVLLEAESEVSRDCDGVPEETSRCGSTACLTLGSVDITPGVNFSDNNGVRAHGGLTLRPSSRIRIGVEARGSELGTPHATGSALMKLEIAGGVQRVVLQTGIEDYPLEIPAAAEHFRLSLSCSLHCP